MGTLVCLERRKKKTPVAINIARITMTTITTPMTKTNEVPVFPPWLLVPDDVSPFPFPFPVVSPLLAKEVVKFPIFRKNKSNLKYNHCLFPRCVRLEDLLRGL